MDVLPTFAKLSGGKVPDDRVIDGKDISPLLFGEPGAKSPYKAFYYWKFRHLEGVRSGKWKLLRRRRGFHLYDLDADIGERNNVAADNPDVVERLKKLFREGEADLNNKKNCRPPAIVNKPKYLIPLEK